MNFDWAELAFGNKSPVKRLKATFIAAPRELSRARFVQLVKAYLPAGNLVIGLAKEDFVDGFADQPQFRTLARAPIQPVIDKVNAAAGRHRIYTLDYYQRETPHVLAALGFSRVVCVNGSWRYSFHSTQTYFVLSGQGTPYELVSPFTDEAEARTYEQRVDPLVRASSELPAVGERLDERALMALTGRIAGRSYDYSNQVGVVLAGPAAGGSAAYRASSFNRVVPYQTYAWHHGGQRDLNFSPPNDLNHYDANHAEVELVLGALRDQIDLTDTSFYINVLPCPTCARMLSRTPIKEFIYATDHSAGYALKVLEMSAKHVRRLVV